MTADTPPPISIDPETGRKLFNARAGTASDRISGKGYDVMTNAEYLKLPASKADAAYDEAWLTRLLRWQNSRATA